jgi:hypothetical protein
MWSRASKKLWLNHLPNRNLSPFQTHYRKYYGLGNFWCTSTLTSVLQFFSKTISLRFSYPRKGDQQARGRGILRSDFFHLSLCSDEGNCSTVFTYRGDDCRSLDETIAWFTIHKTGRDSNGKVEKSTQERWENTLPIIRPIDSKGVAHWRALLVNICGIPV